MIKVNFNNYFTALFTVLALNLFSNPVFADEKTDQKDSARYELQKNGDQFVRLDRHTGMISVCAFEGSELVCRMAVDDRNALVNEMDRLSEQLAKRESGSAQNGQLPKTDEDIDGELDRALEYSTKVIRRFFEVMKDLRKDLEEEYN